MKRSLVDLVGQSLMLSFEGRQATPDVLKALAETRANGVILFAHNIGSPAELHALNRQLQAYAAAIGLPPLLIAIDQEGGTVTRLRAPLTTPPSQMAQAATGDAAAAYDCARITGRQLRAFGINVNFAPVLDVNCNPANPVIGTRSFGQDAAAVGEFALAALRGYHEAGVIATGKHFPGHGDTDIDSHLGLPTVRHERARLDQIELAPFVAALRAGIPALMSAHIIFAALDEHPATLSAPILTDLLRHRLGFDGLVFTDALDMQAVAAQYAPAEAALRSKAAGADVLLPLGSLESQIGVARALAAAVEAGHLSREAFEATARRLDALRATYRITHELPPYEEPDPALYDAALEIARRSVTLIGGKGALPLARETRLALIDCVLPRFSLVEEAFERAALLRSLVAGAFPNSTSLALSPNLTDDDLAQARALAEESDVVVLVTRNAALIAEQARLARMLAALGRLLIHVAARSPYDAAVVSGAAATLLTYGDPDVSLHALVDVLAGRSRPTGSLPVTLPAALQGVVN
ncbi:MAG TPA: beta-N-acetylhexosaminidase [Herpetosiphonaceae bacterium]